MAQIRLLCSDCAGTGSVPTAKMERRGLLGWLGVESRVMATCPRCHGTGDSHPPIAEQQRWEEWSAAYRLAYGPGVFFSPPPPLPDEDSREYFERTGFLNIRPGEHPTEWLERYRKTRAKYTEDEFGTLVRIKGQ